MVFNFGSFYLLQVFKRIGSFIYKYMLPREEQKRWDGTMPTLCNNTKIIPETHDEIKLNDSSFLSFHDRSLILSIKSKLLYIFHFLLKTASL